MQEKKNAFTYARSGAAVVIEQDNLTAHLLVSEITRLIDNPNIREKMKAGAASFAKPKAAREVAEAILDIALKHESR